MVEILNQKGIPHYLKNNWSNSAYGVSGSELVDNIIRIFVPRSHEQQAKDIVNTITGDKDG